MGIFDKFRSSKKIDPEPSPSDKRLHDRFPLTEEDLITIALADGQIGIVTDISYGGLQAKFHPSGILCPHLEGTQGAVFRILDKSADCRVRPVRTVYQGDQLLLAGFQFAHETPAMLLFLRMFIEPMRCGSTLSELGKDVVNDRFKGAEWRCFRGDGPTDLMLRLNADRTDLEEGYLLCRRNETYNEIRYSGGHLVTGQSVPNEGQGNPFGLTDKMSTTKEVDPEILRQGIATLIGARMKSRKMVGPLFDAALAHLGLSRKAA